jgi:hypothetical protein
LIAGKFIKIRDTDLEQIAEVTSGNIVTGQGMNSGTFPGTNRKVSLG